MITAAKAPHRASGVRRGAHHRRRSRRGTALRPSSVPIPDPRIVQDTSDTQEQDQAQLPPLRRQILLARRPRRALLPLLRYEFYVSHFQCYPNAGVLNPLGHCEFRGDTACCHTYGKPDRNPPRRFPRTRVIWLIAWVPLGLMCSRIQRGVGAAVSFRDRAGRDALVVRLSAT